MNWAKTRQLIVRSGGAITCVVVLCLPARPAQANTALLPGTDSRVSASTAQNASVVNKLIASARFWTARKRDDLAIAQIRKALQIAPDNPDALATLGLIEVHMNRLVEASRLVSRLNTLSPDSDAARELDYAYRVAGPDKQEFATIRRLSYSHPAEAVRRLNALFPKGPPQLGDLAADYYDTLAQNPPDRARAIAGLRQVVAMHPDNLKAALNLAYLLNRTSATRMEAASIVERLYKNPASNKPSVLNVWRRVLRAAGSDPAYLKSLQAYLAVEPDDTEFGDLLKATLAVRNKRQALEADPYWQAQREGLALLDKGQTASAAPLLEKAMKKRGNDPELLGGMGILRMRQGRQAQAEELFRRAAKLDKTKRRKWLDLAATAKFWNTVDLSSKAGDSGNQALAERYARAALSMQPSNAYAQTLLVDALIAQKKWRQAEPMLRRLLAGPSPDVGTARSMCALLRGTGRAGEIEPFLSKLEPRYSGERRVAFTRLRADQLGIDADQLLKQGKTGQALEKLEQAIKYDPDSAWTRYTLARTYLNLNLPRLGSEVMDEGLAQSRSDDMRYAAALYRNATDDVQGAIAVLDQVPGKRQTAGMRTLSRKLRAERLLKQARMQFARGEPEKAGQSLRTAQNLASDSPYTLASIGSEWIDRGDADRGLGVLARYIHEHSASPDAGVLLRYGDLLASAGRESQLYNWLAEIRKMPNLDAGQKERLYDQGLRQVLRQADHALSLDDFGLAESILMHARDEYRADPRWRIELAGLRREQGQYAEARKILKAVLAKDPDNFDAQLALARVSEQSGDRRQSLAEVDAVVERARPDDVDTRLSASRRLVALGHARQAKVLTDSLHQRFPGNSDVTVQQGRVLEALGDYDAAKKTFQAALNQEAASGDNTESGGTPAQRALRGLDLRRQPLIETAVVPTYDSGTPGVSELHSLVVPLHVQIPNGYAGHWLLHADTVKLDSGTLRPSADNYSWNSFGQYAASPDADRSAVHTHATGVTLGAGYETDDWRVDIGTTPVGFLVQNVVGGVKVDIPNDYVSLRVNASRRAVTSSELSYAGVRDPVSGSVYGGVVRSGLDVRIARDIGDADVFAQLGAGVFTGRNVETNQAYTLRTGFTVPILQGPNWRVESGLIGNYWHYQKNLDFYTYGQGGYYSPQRYMSAAIPLDWSGRSGRLSWGLHTTLGISQAYTADSNFYPTRPDLQAAAARAGNDNVHEGSRSTGVSYSVAGILQYKFTRHVVGGISFSIDRSTSYEPSSAMIYFRYLFNPDTEPVRFPPHGAQQYADF
jgi:Tfp pilus assembly protein PilF